ncbi:MAG: hypothetical protein AB7O68_07750 [Pirellulales bacterium]
MPIILPRGPSGVEQLAGRRIPRLATSWKRTVQAAGGLKGNRI